MFLLLHAIIPCLDTWIVCGSVNSELWTIYVSSVWSYHNQLFTMRHSGYSLIFGTTIPTFFNILVKYFYTCIGMVWFSMPTGTSPTKPQIHMKIMCIAQEF